MNNNEPQNYRPFFAAPFLVAKLFIGALVVMLLWNAIVPTLFTAGIQHLTYWKAMGLLVLTRILFGGLGGNAYRSKHFQKMQFWKEKMSQMTPEEREQFKAEWKERCRNRKF